MHGAVIFISWHTTLPTRISCDDGVESEAWEPKGEGDESRDV